MPQALRKKLIMFFYSSPFTQDNSKRIRSVQNDTNTGHALHVLCHTPRNVDKCMYMDFCYVYICRDCGVLM